MSDSAETGAAAPDWNDFVKSKSVLRDHLPQYAVIPVASGLTTWALWGLVSWLSFLYWPAVVLIGVLHLLILTMVVSTIRMQVKRMDTATHTLRAAAQGRIELIGTIQPVGDAVVSPLYGIPCASYFINFIGRDGQGNRVVAQETWRSPAVLMTDGENEVFLPLHSTDESSSNVELNRADAPVHLLRQDLRDQIADDGSISDRMERLIPINKPLQVNGVFRTMSSHDSYLEAVNVRKGFIPPTAEELESDPVEQAWRTYCRRREDAAGTNGPVPVDAILPIANFHDLALVRLDNAGWSHAIDQCFVSALVAVPFIYLILRLLDIIEPLPLLY